MRHTSWDPGFQDTRDFQMA